MKTVFPSKHKNLQNLINALNWFAADLQILLTRILKLRLSPNAMPRSLTEDTVSNILLSNLIVSFE